MIINWVCYGLFCSIRVLVLLRRIGEEATCRDLDSAKKVVRKVDYQLE
jgi:hypothetical protein